MSDNFKHTAGLQNVGSYQVSGKPFVTASTVTDGTEEQIEFPEVSNNITVKLDSAAGGAGTNYNSLRISGSTFLTSSGNIYTGDGDGNYSVSLWFKSRDSFDSNRVLFTIGNNSARSSVREKSGRLDFLLSHLGTNASNLASIASYYPAQTDQWNFLTFVSRNTAGGSEATASMNGTVVNTSLAAGLTSVKAYLGTSVKKLQIAGVFFGGTNDFEETIGDEMFIRDFILWDGSLSESDITTLYNGGDYYDFSNFTTYDKLCWIKPDENLGTSFDDTSQITNSGTTGSFMEVTNYDSGEIVEVSTDAPFADVPGSGGELRVHFRSTGSLPNVATNKHYWTLDSQNESITMNVKSKELYLSADGGDCDYSVEAELTNIPSSRMFQHTGSGVDE